MELRLGELDSVLPSGGEILLPPSLSGYEERSGRVFLPLSPHKNVKSFSWPTLNVHPSPDS